jgi:integrase
MSTPRKSTGIEVRHARFCATREDRACNCTPSVRAWVYDRRAGGKTRKTYTGSGALAEAKGWRADAIGQVRRGLLKAGPSPTLRVAGEAWIEAAERGEIRTRSGDEWKPSTLRGYRRSLRDRILPDLGDVKLADLRRVDVQDLADRLLADGLDPSTIRNALMPLRGIFRRAVSRGDVAVSPMSGLELPAVRGRRDRIAEPAEALRLIETLPEEDRALWACVFYAGLRLGELRALEYDRNDGLDLAGGVIHVRQSWDQHAGRVAPTSRAGVRDVPIAGVLRDYLVAHKLRSGRSDGLVFGRKATSPFNPSSVAKRAAAAWAKANAEELERAEEEGRKPSLLEPIGLHECRHTAISTWAEAGVSAKRISTWAGHSSVAFTLDRYAKVFEKLERSEMERVDDFLALADTGARIEQLDA